MTHQRFVSLVAAALALGILAVAPAAHARKLAPRDNLAAIVLVTTGGFVAVTGSILVGTGASFGAGGYCPGYPSSPDVCRGLASDYTTSGWTIVGVGLGAAFAGGLTFAIEAR